MSTNHRYAHLDAMRAIAALCVAVLHISQVMEFSSSGGLWLLEFADDWQIGDFGVSLFFLVSGFVIPASFGDGVSRREGLRVFAIRRFFRLYPAYWLSIPFGLWAVFWLHDKPIDWPTVAVNITMLQSVLGFRNLMGFYWTLAYELVFYVLCAGLFALGLLNRAGALVAMLSLLLLGYVVVLVLGLRHTDLQFYADMPTQLGLMFTGAIFRQWHDGKGLNRWVKAMLALVVVMYAIPAARSVRFDDGHLIFDPTGGWGVALALLFFIVFVMRWRLSHPVLSWLGTISYSFYLFHTPFAHLAAWVLTLPGMAWAVGWDLTVYCAVLLVLTGIFSAAVYRWLELPAIELGRRLSRPATASDSVARPRPYA